MEKLLKNTRLLVLFTVLILVSGYSALSTLPRAEDPALVNRWATITTAYPGASAERVEALVTEPVENELRSLDEINLIESQSKPGISVITVELNDSLTETEPVWSKIRDKLSDAVPSLPDDALEPEFDNDHSNAFTYITALKWNGNGEPDELILGRYAKELAKRWRNLSGTEFVDIHGLPAEEILVTLDIADASALGQTALSLSQSIVGADAKNAAGELHNDNNRFQLEVAGALDSITRVKQVPVAMDPNGFLVRLEDIATVKRTKAMPPDQIAIIDGEPAVLVSARMQSSIRVDQWTHSADKMLDVFRSELPDNIELKPLFKQSRYTETRLSDLVDSLLLGFGLVLIVLFVTLGFRSAILVALSLPIASAFTLAMMSFTGLPINQMSVTGLIVSLGIMVDNAIVMVDTIQHFRQQNVKRLESAMRAIRHLWLPLLGSTLTTILAFAPIFLMPGPAGEFVGAIAITVSFSLVGSYIVSQLLVSGFAARWLPAGESSTRWYHAGINIPAISKLFKQTVRTAVRFPWLSIPLVFLVPFAGFWSAGQLTEQFFPPSDRDMFEIQVFLAPQASIATTLETTKEIDAVLAKTDDIEQVGWLHGTNFPSFYYNIMARQHGAPNFAQAMVKAKDFNAANEMIPELQVTLSRKFPHAQILVRKLEQGPPFNAPIEVRVYGPNLDTLREISERVRLLMSETPDVINTRETLQPGTPKISVNVNEESSHLTGMRLADIALLLNASMSGIVQGSVIEGTESIPVRVRVSDESRSNLNQLSQLRLPISGGNTPSDLPLSALAEMSVEPSRGSIPHRNGERINVIEGYITAGVLPQTALNAFTDILERTDLKLPPGYRLEFGGESAERDASVNQLMANLTIVIILLIAVVVISFNSFRLSGIIFLAGIQAAGLGLLSVWAFGYPFGFTVIIGLLGLVGLAINASIVILAELKANPAAKSGDVDAIVDAVSSCGRHITSTTITTIGGFLPLILAGGGFWPPFAIAIAGGTLLTTILSFYFVPAAFKTAGWLRPYDKPCALESCDVES
ncbi:efflux RND transporter permease subunit [Enterovibrio sp. ZSDZ35]|uniref:Efflux RND transporter permease subunit n=1 Tax=Enterovibrio qingdaonensis TaxID=2899818 RepID=A0ABT5QFW9_9GAMM|nr:efflux RND transporter permease subunit [Enterovibrio sp. ZSDZ35]MDD1779871.1 efflux RND transporter permease subunit [Enterovibrio sp. ZSDZ35]